MSDPILPMSVCIAIPSRPCIFRTSTKVVSSGVGSVTYADHFLSSKPSIALCFEFGILRTKCTLNVSQTIEICLTFRILLNVESGPLKTFGIKWGEISSLPTKEKLTRKEKKNTTAVLLLVLFGSIERVLLSTILVLVLSTLVVLVLLVSNFGNFGNLGTI